MDSSTTQFAENTFGRLSQLWSMQISALIGYLILLASVFVGMVLHYVSGYRRGLDLILRDFAQAVSASCLTICALILIITLPIYLRSDDETRAKKAGGLVKLSLVFIIIFGTALLVL